METFQQSFYLGSVCGNQVFQRIRDSASSILPLEAAVPFGELATHCLQGQPIGLGSQLAVELFFTRNTSWPPSCFPLALSAHQEEIANILSAHHSHTGFSSFILQQQPCGIGRYCYYPHCTHEKTGTGSNLPKSHSHKQPCGFQPVVHSNHRDLKAWLESSPGQRGAVQGPLSSCGQAPCWP